MENKYNYKWTKKEHCLPKDYEKLLEKIDKDLQRVDILLHSTTLERIADSVFEFIKKKSKEEK